MKEVIEKAIALIATLEEAMGRHGVAIPQTDGSTYTQKGIEALLKGADNRGARALWAVMTTLKLIYEDVAAGKDLKQHEKQYADYFAVITECTLLLKGMPLKSGEITKTDALLNELAYLAYEYANACKNNPDLIQTVQTLSPAFPGTLKFGVKLAGLEGNHAGILNFALDSIIGLCAEAVETYNKNKGRAKKSDAEASRNTCLASIQTHRRQIKPNASEADLAATTAQLEGIVSNYKGPKEFYTVDRKKEEVVEKGKKTKKEVITLTPVPVLAEITQQVQEAITQINTKAQTPTTSTRAAPSSPAKPQVSPVTTSTLVEEGDELARLQKELRTLDAQIALQADKITSAQTTLEAHDEATLQTNQQTLAARKVQLTERRQQMTEQQTADKTEHDKNVALKAYIDTVVSALTAPAEPGENKEVVPFETLAPGKDPTRSKRSKTLREMNTKIVFDQLELDANLQKRWATMRTLQNKHTKKSIIGKKSKNIPEKAAQQLQAFKEELTQRAKQRQEAVTQAITPFQTLSAEITALEAQLLTCTTELATCENDQRLMTEHRAQLDAMITEQASNTAKRTELNASIATLVAQRASAPADYAKPVDAANSGKAPIVPDTASPASPEAIANGDDEHAKRQQIANDAKQAFKDYLTQQKKDYRVRNFISRTFFRVAFSANLARPNESKRRHFVEDKLNAALDNFVGTGNTAELDTLISEGSKKFRSRTTDEKKSAYQHTMFKRFKDLKISVEKYKMEITLKV